MAEKHRMTADEVVSQLLSEEHADFLRESLRWMVEQLMEAEVSELVGAAHGERTPARATHRNGYRPRRWDTRAGELELQIPKLRRGSYFPSFLEPRRRSEQALLNVVQQAYVCGVSTRKVDQLVESLGLRISRSEVSRIAGGLDEQVEAFRLRPLEGRYPYLFLDADISVADASTIIARTRFDRCLAPVEIRFSRCASAAESGRTNTSGGRIHHLLDRDASQPADSEAARLLAADQADREEEQARLDPEALERHEGPDQAAASVGNDGKPIDVESQAQLQVYLDSKAAQH